MRVHVVQPIAAHYRIPLFDRLFSHKDISLTLFASKAFPGSESIKTVNELEYATIGSGTDAFLGQFYWQRGVTLPKDLSSGDVLVVNGNLRILSNWPLIVSARQRGIGVVWWGHGSSRAPKRVVESIRHIIVRTMDAILLYTDFEKSIYAELGVPEEMLFATNNTVDDQSIAQATSHWHGTHMVDFAKEERLGDEPRLLYVGRLKSSAHLDLALRSLRYLQQHTGDCSLVVIGDGAENYRLRELTKELKLEETVRWLGAIYDEMSLAPWFLSADVCVYPGPIGLSLLHAFHYGIPVITHDNLENHGPEIAALQPGKNGLVFKAGDYIDLAKQTACILNDPSLQQELSMEALKTAQEHYRIDNMVERFLSAVRYASANALRRHSKR